MSDPTLPTKSGRVSPSNRRETSPKFGGRAPVGVDRLSLSFPIEGFEADPSAWSSVSISAPGTPAAAESRHATIDGVFVGVREVPGSGSARLWGKIEANPARVMDPEGYQALDPSALVEAVEKMWTSAEQVLKPKCDPDDARVKRLDVARDFGQVARPDFYLRGLAPVHRPWARRNLVHFDPAKKGAQTLMVGSGSGIVRLYDKHAETDGKAPEGTLRWEVEARSGWCKQYGEMSRLCDVDNERIEALAMDRWEWSAMGTEVTATERVIEQVMRSGLSHAKQRAFLGYLMMKAHGVEAPLSNDTASEYRRLVRALGITLAADTFGASGGFVGRLDWESGQEVLCVAA